jgi:membrane protein
MSPTFPDHPLARFWFHLWRLIRLTAHEFLGDRCFDKSASLAYVSLLGIFAVFTVVLSVQSIVFRNNAEAETRFRDYVVDLLLPTVVDETSESEASHPQRGVNVASPEAAAVAPTPGGLAGTQGPGPQSPPAVNQAELNLRVREQFQQLIPVFENFRQNALSLGALGVIGLVIVSMMLFTSVEKGFNEVFHVRRKRPFFRAFATYTAVLVWAPIFIGVTFALSLQMGERLAWLSPGATALVMTCGTFTIAYWLIPNTRVSPVTALVGGLTAGLLWEMVKIGFVLYIVTVPTTRNFLLALGVVPTFLIWLYMTWVVLFLGLEICYVLQHYKPLSGRMFNREAMLELNPRHLLMTLYELAQRFDRGRPSITVSDLMKATHLDELHIHQLLDHCQERGWVFASEAHAVYHLARPPEQIALRDVLLSPVTQVVEVPVAGSSSPLEEFWARYDQTAQAALPAESLREVVHFKRAEAGPVRQRGDAS